MGCPKLDDADYYREKLARIIRVNDSPSITVVRMEVPAAEVLHSLLRRPLTRQGWMLN
jgi:hypothetical protein